MRRIGLTQRVEFLADRGERRDCLDQAWTLLLVRAGLWPVPLPNRVPCAEDLIDRYDLDGVVLTGGNDLADLPGASNTAPERDHVEHGLLDACAVRRLPVLGVCRGFQLLCVHFGGALVPVEGHVARRHGLRRLGGPMPEIAADPVNSFHGWGILETDVPAPLRAAARAPDGTIEAVYHDRLPLWGVMWHPERAPMEDDGERLLQALFCGGTP